MSPRTRLSRKEKQAHTRTCLMASAAKIFARRGLDQASIDEVAADAGFTKGAFYANFKNKEELFLAMLDERFAERLKALEQILSGDGTAAEQAREGGERFVRYLVADPEWQRIFFEFAAYAARNDEFREELVTRYRALREKMAEAFARHAGKERGKSEMIAMALFAMGNGIALEKLLEPDAVPDDLYPRMLEIFFTGLQAAEGVPAPATA